MSKTPITGRYAGPALLLLALILITGCGFQLRGQAMLPPQMALTYIGYDRSYNPDSPLVRALEKALRANGVTVTDSQELASTRIQIIGESLRRRTLAVDSESDAREYELIYEVTYAVILQDGTRLVPRDNLFTTRNLFYAESQVLGRSEGEALSVNDMANDLAWSILRRIQAAEQPS